ncbi:hypothetical protein AKJ09_10109 [Labilithrix luteola]|uniref:Uncharacterized protein n=1 Tax=Labilithrix luteola TaxID=1391654 RepID=A0A0K1QCD8_9BACT|nr:hypothetical protein AKJ09_10109 [Labilithrix luteola]
MGQGGSCIGHRTGEYDPVALEPERTRENGRVTFRDVDKKDRLHATVRD